MSLPVERGVLLISTGRRRAEQPDHLKMRVNMPGGMVNGMDGLFSVMRLTIIQTGSTVAETVLP